MGLRDQLKKTKILNTPTSKKLPKDNLDKREITIILNLIKGTTFKGDNIETMYNLILKLQNQYTKLN